MNWDRVACSWKLMTRKLKAQWGKPTDYDLTVIDGQQLVDRIQERYRIAKDQTERGLPHSSSRNRMQDEG